jgi:hypothetical protein
MLSFMQSPIYRAQALTGENLRGSLTAQLQHVNELTAEYAQAFGYVDGWTPASEAVERIMALLMSDAPIDNRAYAEAMVFAVNVCDDLASQVYPDDIDVEESIAIWEALPPPRTERETAAELEMA